MINERINYNKKNMTQQQSLPEPGKLPVPNPNKTNKKNQLKKKIETKIKKKDVVSIAS